MFAKNVNKRSKAAMIQFLTVHFRYYTMNSWNRTTSYANNVKLNNLQLPENLDDKAYEFLSAECRDYYYDIDERINMFTRKTGYAAGFNGRSDGYIVLYDTKREDDGYKIIMSGIDEDTDFDDWSVDELRERTRLVEAFDKLCDDIRDIFIHYVKNAKIEYVTIMQPIHKTIAVIPEKGDAT